MSNTILIEFFTEISAFSINSLFRALDYALRNNAERILLNIYSSGGTVSNALAAYEYLRGFRIPVDTISVGQVDSAAIMLYLAGSRRFIGSDASFLLHAIKHPVDPAMANFHQLTQCLAQLEIDISRYAKIVRTRTMEHASDFQDVPDYEQILRRDSLRIGSADALRLGFAHEIVDVNPFIIQNVTSRVPVVV